MVQSYGTTHSTPGPSSRPIESVQRTSGEHEALLGDDASVKKSLRDGHATLQSSIGNLANTIIGSGMLTFPLALASAGIIPGMITCLFSGGVAAFGLYLLSLCAAKAPHRRASFFAVAELTFPRAAVFFDAAIAIKCFGVSISYLIIVKSLMPNVVAAIYHDLTSPDVNPPAWALSGRNWITVIMFILFPLSFLRHLNSLRHTSYVALFSVVYLVVIVVTCYFFPLKGTEKAGEIHLVHFTSNFISTFPVQVFAYTCAQNLFPIFNEISSNTQKRMNIVIGSSIGGAAIIYEIIAVFGYLTFGSKVTANIIAMYPSTSLFIAFGQLAIAILVMFSYPLQVHPCRNCLDKVFHNGHVNHIKTSADEEDDTEVVDEHGGSPDMSPLKHTLLTIAIVISGFTIAYFVDDLQMVLSFVGSTGSTTISFILPGLFYWKLSHDDPTANRTLNKAALALAIYGLFIFVFCLTYNIYQVLHVEVSHSIRETAICRTVNVPSLAFHIVHPVRSNGLMDTTTMALSPTPAHASSASTSGSEVYCSQILNAPITPSSPETQTPQSSSSDITSNGESFPSHNETDPQIIEALKSKDRLYVLKLGEQMESLITERRTKIDLNPTTTYQRMLAHRCSSFYKLSPETDNTTKTISVYYRAESRIPTRRICDLVPLEEVAQPTFKIMQRNLQDRSRVRHNSQPGSVTGDDADTSDAEPSETGSAGGRSNITGSSKRFRTIEEREAAYNEARSRIFMDFQEKEKEKEKDMSTNSSTSSLISGSGSTSGTRSRMGDLDDSASSAATESEWSGPIARDKRDVRRGGSATSSRSMRSNEYTNGSGSSRNSRATSPSFTYPSLYDPSGNPPPFDPSFGPQGPPHGYIQYYYHPQYPTPPPNQGPGQPYLTPYSYYPPYYAPQSQPPPPHHSDPTSPAPVDPMYQPQTAPPQMPYPGQYYWPQTTTNQPNQHTSPTNGIPGHPVPPSQGPPPGPQQQASYPYVPPQPYAPYAMNGYYPPARYQQGQQPLPAPPMQRGPSFFSPDGMHPGDNGGIGQSNVAPNVFDSANHSRASSRNSSNNGVSRRGAPRARQAWSYGPGVASGGVPYPGAGGILPIDTVGPRLSTRRTSGNSSGGSAGNKTPGDEASSTHPLPARPDWAVGLKAHPTLHQPRTHDHSNPHSRTMSPARMGGQTHTPNQLHQQHVNQNQASHPPQNILQSTDFPPLSSAPEKRTSPNVGGAWTNPSSTVRSIIMAPNGPPTQGATHPHGPNPSGNVLVHYPSNNGSRLDEQDRTFERPPPKNAELFNPKGVLRKGQPQQLVQNGSPSLIVGSSPSPSSSGFIGECSNGLAEKDAVDGLVNQIGGLTLVEGSMSNQGSNGVSSPPPPSLMEAKVAVVES
ncbi:amino acid/polyamine transporter 2 family protein [Abortiporus biennis]